MTRFDYYTEIFKKFGKDRNAIQVEYDYTHAITKFQLYTGRYTNKKNRFHTQINLPHHIYEYRAFFLVNYLKQKKGGLRFSNYATKSRSIVRGRVRATSNPILRYVDKVMFDRAYPKKSNDKSHYIISQRIFKTIYSRDMNNVLECFKIVLNRDIVGLGERRWRKFRKELIDLGFMLPISNKYGVYYLNMNWYPDYISSQVRWFVWNQLSYNLSFDCIRCEVLSYQTKTMRVVYKVRPLSYYELINYGLKPVYKYYVENSLLNKPSLLFRK